MELDDRSALPADLVIVGIGVRPATDFVQGAPLNPRRQPRRGRAVPRGAEGVWATGDIARFPYPYGGRRAGAHRALARRLAARARGGEVDGGQGRALPGRALLLDAAARRVGEVRRLRARVGRGHDHRRHPGRKFLGYYVKGNRLLAAVGTLSGHLLSFAELLRLGRLPTADTLRGKPPEEITRVLKAVIRIAADERRGCEIGYRDRPVFDVRRHPWYH